MLGLLLLLQFPADIVVTGQKLVEAQAECARGGCTPLRDAQATIALAEVRFRDGNYQDAKRLLAAGASRNRDKEAQEPRAVAALYEAYATVSLHEGDRKEYRRAVADQVRVLNAHLPADDPSVLSAATALGDMWIELGNYAQAEVTYRGIEERALSGGRDRAAMLAGMKRVWIEAARMQSEKPYRMIDALEQRPVAKEAGFAGALKVLRLRLAARDAKGEEVTRLIRELGKAGGPEPVLLVSPPYALDAATAAERVNGAQDLRDLRNVGAADLSGIQWADVGFWVRPDGRTEDIEILRGSRGRGWMKPALDQIAARRYSASGGAGAEGGVYRVERFTMAAEYQTPKGSLISRRVAKGGYEVLDLTEAPAAPPGG
jgi:hypothetical protein